MSYRCTCPECEFAFELDDPMVDEVVVCGDCALNLRIVSIDAATRAVRAELTETSHQDWGE
jgi:lysine biosynthesis protein LysW